MHKTKNSKSTFTRRHGTMNHVFSNFAEKGWFMGRIRTRPIVTYKDDFQINSQNVKMGNILRMA